MSMQAKIQLLIQAIATDIKSLTSGQGSLSALSTTNKTSLVSALNELKGVIDSINTGSIIDDALTTSAAKTYSIDKIKSVVSAAISDLVASAPTALDTLNELAAAITSDQSGIAALVTAVGNRVAFDQAQTLTAGQQTQACSNLGIGDPATDLVAEYTAAKV